MSTSVTSTRGCVEPGAAAAAAAALRPSRSLLEALTEAEAEAVMASWGRASSSMAHLVRGRG